MEAGRRIHEVQYFPGDIQVCIAGPGKEQVIFTGKLALIEELHGVIIEWHPIVDSDADRSPERKASPDSENLDWVDVSSPVVGYKVDREDDTEAIEFKTVNRLPTVISIELSELKSYKRYYVSIEQDKIGLVFFLKDGTNIPTFYLDSEQLSTLLDALSKYLNFTQSASDDNLYVITDPKEEEALTKSFSELHLFGENKAHIVTKFLQDPYATTMGGFSRVTNYILESLVYNNDTSTHPCSDQEVAEMLKHEGLSHINISQQEEHGFEVISCFELPPRPTVKRAEPVTVEEWMSYVAKDGRIHNVKELKQRIFKGGLTDSLRPEAWKYLLDYYSFRSTNKDRDMIKRRKVDDYYRMKLQWRSMSADQESRFSALRDRKSLVEKDVSRTDRILPDFEGDNNSNVMMLYDILMTYCMYNFDLGYVQGMSDLLSPILVVMQNESEAFWCFAGWLDKIGANFEMDQQGMKTQLMNLHRLLHFVDSKFCSYLESHESGNLYFCFRWLLILFKRDFKFNEVMRLWEVLWTDLPCDNFHLLICVAILDKEKNTIMENNYGLTEILKHINDMSYKIDLEEILCKAEAIYLQIKASCHLSDVVQEILGLHPPYEEESLMATASKESLHGVREMQNFCYGSYLGDTAYDPKNSSQHSNVSIDDYVDLEQQYQQSVEKYYL